MAQTASQSQQAVAFDGWRKMAEDQVTRLGTMADELGKLESASLDQAQSAVRELARLTQESLAYAGRLSADWRKLVVEVTRGTSELWKVRA